MTKRSLSSKLLAGAKALLDAAERSGLLTDEATVAVQVDLGKDVTVVDGKVVQPDEPEGPEPTPLRDAAFATRKEVIKLAGDANGIRWDIAEKQVEFEADFAAFCMAWWANERPAADYDELRRRALIAVTVFHGVAIEDLPEKLRKQTGE